MGRGKYKSKPTGRRQFSTPEDLRESLFPFPAKRLRLWPLKWNFYNLDEISGMWVVHECFDVEMEFVGIVRSGETPRLVAGTSNRPRTFKQKEAEHVEEESEEASGDESGEESEEESSKKKGTQGIIEIENPNLVKPKSVKARDVDVGKTTELSRQRLALIRQQRAEAAKKREEEKAAKEQKKAEARK
ncbi:uncharacterized protein HKW66_Vig0066100 [Vigna angularis]|uniref:Casein kinase substrate phosphoprotein PP28 domain-containing protein n=1 Tax=Phaseolus angularis TaxID=3914 RepID=A0A8T0K8T2_PHAAN|nr:uncharacterized protein HKW66_Vig0066100 [Vigna angularis]